MIPPSPGLLPTVGSLQEIPPIPYREGSAARGFGTRNQSPGNGMRCLWSWRLPEQMESHISTPSINDSCEEGQDITHEKRRGLEECYDLKTPRLSGREQLEKRKAVDKDHMPRPSIGQGPKGGMQFGSDFPCRRLWNSSPSCSRGAPYLPRLMSHCSNAMAPRTRPRSWREV